MSLRYRLYPTVAQEVTLREHCAHARFVWNLCVEQQSWWHPGRQPAPNWVERNRQLTEARAEFAWLKSGSQEVQSEALRDFARANDAFFAKTHKRPTWRKVGRREGFSVHQVGRSYRFRRVSRHVGEVQAPKLGWVRFRWSRPAPLEAKSYRITLDNAGRWHISFTALQPALDRQATGSSIGIDRGVRTALVTSGGQHYRAPRISDRQAARCVALQRRMARQQKGSRKREKTRRALAKIQAKVTDRRRDWAEKISTRLVIDHDLIVFEKLNTKAMTRKPAPKPDPERPDAFLPNRARAKAGLNRGILASCWGTLAARAEHKAIASGVTVIYVNPRFTSQQCRVCGHIASASRESQATFRCANCGHFDHADTNAAKNILARGLVSFRSCASPGAPGVCLHKSAQAAAGTILEAS
jgi:putative transposase